MLVVDRDGSVSGAVVARTVYSPRAGTRRTGTVVPRCVGPTGPSRRVVTLAEASGRVDGLRLKVCYAREMTAAAPRTIVEKIWTDHVVTQDPGAPAVLAVDLHLVHEVTSPQAFSGLRARGIGVRRPGQTVATPDHSIPTTDRSLPFIDAMALAQVNQLEANCTEFGIPLHGIGDPGQGIVHVIGPQLGLTQPGHDHRVRRFAHEHARRVRRARVRDRHERGRDGPRHPDACSSATRRPTRSGSTAGSPPASAPRTSSSR